MLNASGRFASVGDLPAGELAERLATRGLGLRMGPFDVHMTVQVPDLHASFRDLYAAYPLLPDDEQVFSFHVKLRQLPRWFPWQAEQVRFTVDGRVPHADMPADQALAVLEWGLNLVVSLRFHCFMLFHAGVVERNGRALVLPAAPGSGKTTLSAALVNSGWRLLSDEFGIVRAGAAQFLPLPRLMPLKNESIAVMRRFAPAATFGPMIPGTRKGDIVHMVPPRASIERAAQPATAAWLVFPQWLQDAPLRLEPVTRGAAFMSLAANAFNYELQGMDGFRSVEQIIAGCDCFTLDYGNLDEAVARLTQLADAAP